MNTVAKGRLCTAERRVFETMTDAQLKAIAAEAPWMDKLSDRALEMIAAGGPVPIRFARLVCDD